MFQRTKLESCLDQSDDLGTYRTCRTAGRGSENKEEMFMSDDPSGKHNDQALATHPEVKRKRKRQYSDEDKAVALAALDANNGLVKRTATQLGIPHKTLDDWAKGRNQHPEVADLHTRKKGSLADKFENLAHLIVDAMPAKIAKATLSQCAVSSGIATDKAMRLREERPYPDPTTELCQLLGLKPSQLPAALQLEPGEEIPEGFGAIIDVTAKPVEMTEKPAQGGDECTTEEAAGGLNLLDDH